MGNVFISPKDNQEQFPTLFFKWLSADAWEEKHALTPSQSTFIGECVLSLYFQASKGKRKVSSSLGLAKLSPITPQPFTPF
eukprot:m.239435 g.239435  ORF g.239435 m.239435 type:complete len:81 (+) comp13937_c0_seq12:1053-1295(+)